MRGAPWLKSGFGLGSLRTEKRYRIVMKVSRNSQRERKAKRRKRFRVVMEIILMALGVLCGIMPQPFPLLVPILIGTVRIVGRALEKEPEPPSAPVVYCNGHVAPDKLKKEQKQNVRQAKKTRRESIEAGTEKSRKRVTCK